MNKPELIALLIIFILQLMNQAFAEDQQPNS